MLTDKMEEWGELTRKADTLKKEIEDEVLLLKTSVEVEGVGVKYSPGRRSYDYAWLAKTIGVSEEVVVKHTKVTSKVDWLLACKACGYTEEQLVSVASASAPSAKIGLAKAKK